MSLKSSDQSRQYKKGRGAQVNLKNRFHKSYFDTSDQDGIDDFSESASHTQVLHEHPKTIISMNDSPDLAWNHSINPYQGCEHGCIYCYARNTHEYWGYSAGTDFESKIIVKKNAAKLLENKFLSKQWKPAVVMLSGNTDCYQPLERKYRITRSLLEIFKKYQNPVAIITKNSLIERDIDILKDLSRHNLIHVTLSITTEDESLRQKMEPRTSSSANRFRTVHRLNRSNIPVSVMIAPVIPGLNHHEIPAIVKKSAENGAKAISYATVRLNGQVGPIFNDWLNKNYKLRSEKILNQTKWLHQGQINDTEWGRRMKGDGELAKSISSLFKASVKKFFPTNALTPYDFTRFRFGGNYTLF